MSTAPRWRVLTAALLCGFVCAAVTNAQVTPGAPVEGTIRSGLAVPMRDGTRLATDVYLPAATGRWPAILIRTPYGRKSSGISGYRFFASHGYAVVMQDVRGRYGSQGVTGAISQEGPDGNDAINWVAEQTWSNGRVAMAGGSYLGIVQWWAALQENPHLVTISPAVSGDDEYSDRFYSQGSALKLGHRLTWLSENFTPPSLLRPRFDEYVRHLPLRTADRAATGRTLPIWQAALDHPSYDRYWRSLSVREQITNVRIPVLSFGGWFDNYASGDLDAFSRLAAVHRTIETWIGPWTHNFGYRFPTIDFGLDARLPVRQQQLDWFGRWLKDRPPNPDAEARLHIFVMGPNYWRTEKEWPLARTRYTSLFLASDLKRAADPAAAGRLIWRKSPGSQPDHYVYDPGAPTPTVGGALCCDARLMPPGPLDQTAVEARHDVLIYTSPPLDADLEVTGPVRTILYAATSSNDTDFTAKLVDVAPAGTPLLVTDGIERVRYRNALDRPTFVKRGSPYQISIPCGVTSWVFAAGHRIRLEIASSNFPRFDRNLNTPQPVADETAIVRARQIIYHDRRYPSALILPVIPGPETQARAPRKRGLVAKRPPRSASPGDSVKAGGKAGFAPQHHSLDNPKPATVR